MVSNMWKKGTEQGDRLELPTPAPTAELDLGNSTVWDERGLAETWVIGVGLRPTGKRGG